jgi:hypothetical protein
MKWTAFVVSDPIPITSTVQYAWACPNSRPWNYWKHRMLAPSAPPNCRCGCRMAWRGERWICPQATFFSFGEHYLAAPGPAPTCTCGREMVWASKLVWVCLESRPWNSWRHKPARNTQAVV